MDYTMSQLRSMLNECRQKIGELVPKANEYHNQLKQAQKQYKRALAFAKIDALNVATTKDHKQSTMILAYAEIDEKVIKAQDDLTLAECMDEACKLQLDSLERDCQSYKKSIDSILVEMRQFCG